MGRNESTVELLVKVWEGIREFLEVRNESTGFFFRHHTCLNGLFLFTAGLFYKKWDGLKISPIC